MDKPAILQRLGEIMQVQYGVTAVSYSPETTLRELNIDSMISADLMLEIEDAFGFTFKTMDIPREPTVQDIVDLVHLNLEASPP